MTENPKENRTASYRTTPLRAMPLESFEEEYRAGRIDIHVLLAMREMFRRQPRIFANALPKSRCIYALAEKGDAIELDVYDVVGLGGDSPTAKQVLDRLSSAKNAKTIELRINSAGGLVDEGLSMYSLLAQHPARKIVHVDSLAASIASVLCMCGDEIVMAESAMMMIHNPWSLALGDAAELRKTADILDKRAGQLAGIYSARTGQSLPNVFDAMARETWMTANEAKALGYATRIVPSKGIAARARVFDLTPFRHVPAAAYALAATTKPTTSVRTMRR
ncbi:MAG TPA: head maturation protease, ClpP-related [Polyangiaceae bacterium]|nr:head maturation protease, ClpP-related [Polyangiaceae bacterium]